MELIFLGTSSGMPTKRRNVSGLALLTDYGKGWYLIDCGEATQHQILRTPLSLHRLRAIFITHVHGDHCYGLPGLLASAAMSGRKSPLTIIAPQGIEAWITATLQLTALPLPFELQFVCVESAASWKDDYVQVEATPLSHRVPSFAYSFTEAKRESYLNIEKLTADHIPRGPLWGRLKRGTNVRYAGKLLMSNDYLCFPYKARKIVVGGDNDQPELLREQCREAQVLVHEATFTEDIAAKVGGGYQHSTAKAVAAFAESLDLPNLVLTHFSARYQSDPGKSPSIADIQTEAAAHYHGQLFLAEDFAHYRLNKTGQLILNP